MSSKVRTNKNGCRKAGPWLPGNQPTWHCETHRVDLVFLGLGPHREQRWACPVMESELIEANAERRAKGGWK